MTSLSQFFLISDYFPFFLLSKLYNFSYLILIILFYNDHLFAQNYMVPFIPILNFYSQKLMCSYQILTSRVRVYLREGTMKGYNIYHTPSRWDPNHHM